MNTSVDHYRANLKYRNTIDLNAADSVRTKDDVHQKLNYEDLLTIIQSLSPSYRTVFNLFAIDGYTHEEIASKLGISIGASKSNLFKARKKLQEAIQDGSKGIPRNAEHMKIISINYPGKLGTNTGTKL